MSAQIIKFPQHRIPGVRTDLAGITEILVLPVVRVERQPGMSARRTPSPDPSGMLLGAAAADICMRAFAELSQAIALQMEWIP